MIYHLAGIQVGSTSKITLISVSCTAQILPGTVEYAVYHIIERRLCLCDFDNHYLNLSPT